MSARLSAAKTERNGLPVDAITRVRVLDPYFYADDARQQR
jgi:hypothetical protein